MMNKLLTNRPLPITACEPPTLGLYLHFPFCRRKCSYCDFYSVVPSESTQIEDYVCALLENMAQICASGAVNDPVNSVFVGGGTPSLLSGEQVRRILQAISQNFTLSGDCEITLESNPATMTLESLCQYRGAGVNRLSIGLQSAHDCELADLSRLHSQKDFLLAFHQARQAGFDNINFDLMFGIPGQSLESFMQTLDFATALGPEHLAVYGLRIEEGTPLALRDPASYTLPSEETECRMYLDAIDYLHMKGYCQYEISNFSKPGRECRHNLKYWNCEPYVGLGPSAHSYLNGVRYSYVRDIRAYCVGLLSGAPHTRLFEERCEITEEESEREYIMLRLRLSEGICARRFAGRYHKDFEKIYAPRLAPYIREGLAYHEDGRYALTPRGMLVSNGILCDLIDF